MPFFLCLGVISKANSNVRFAMYDSHTGRARFESTTHMMICHSSMGCQRSGSASHRTELRELLWVQTLLVPKWIPWRSMLILEINSFHVYLRRNLQNRFECISSVLTFSRVHIRCTVDIFQKSQCGSLTQQRHRRMYEECVVLVLLAR